MKMRSALLLLFSVVLAASSVRAGESAIHRVAEKVPNSYIVMLRPGQAAAEVAPEAEHRYGGKATHVMDRLGMFAMTLPNEAAAEAIARDPRVLEVQENGVLHIESTCRSLSSSGSQWALAHLNGLDRVRTFSGVFGDSVSSVQLFVIDSRIDDSSLDFRAGVGYPSKVHEVHVSISLCGGDNGNDPPEKLAGPISNHGGAVASLIAGNIHGVVPQVTSILSIVAADCLGLSNDAALADAANYVVTTHQAGTPAVANVSIAASGPDDSFDQSMKSMVDDGIFVTVAAGNGGPNGGVDACTVSAARLGGTNRYPGFMAVGATTTYGSKASYSNYGACVDIWAPGGDSTTGVETATGTGYGTSLAAPEVAGAAIVLYSRYPLWSPMSVWSKLKGDAMAPWGYLQARVPEDTTCSYLICDSLGCRYVSYY